MATIPNSKRNRALKKALANTPGGRSGMAKALKITGQSIDDWFRKGKVPATRCIQVEAACGGTVTRYELRPDVFGSAPPDALKQTG